MGDKSIISIRIDSELKESAENILKQLGISPSAAIKMFYSQIVLQNDLPFKLRIPTNKPLSIANLSKEELDLEIQKGIDSLNSGKVCTEKEVDEYLKKLWMCI